MTITKPYTIMQDEYLRLDEALDKAHSNLRAFEEQHQLSTDDFISRYAKSEVPETLDTIEWYGEYRMAQHIQQQIDNVKRVR